MLKHLKMCKEEDYKTAKLCFLIVFVIVFASPCFYFNGLVMMFSDLMVQIKSGLWMLDNKQLILEDVFSWHQNLNWCQHEIGWYFIAALLYKVGGLYGIILFAHLCYMGLGLLFIRENRNNSLISCVVSFLLLIVPSYVVLYNIRPYTISTPLIMYLLVSLWSNKEEKSKGIVFLVVTVIVAWVHGGMIPLIFVIYLVNLVINLVCKQSKAAIIDVVFLVVGFVISLLNPVGIEIWTYALKQSQGTEIWNNISEWNPGTLTFLNAFVVLATMVCALLKNNLHKLDRKVLLQTAYVCMFALMFFKYARFRVLFFICLAFIAPNLYDNLFTWLYTRFKCVKRFVKFKFCSAILTDRKLILSKLLLFAGVIPMTLLIVVGYAMVMQYLPSNDINEIADNAGYPQEVITEIKSRGYERILNSYNAGTWLLYNDIKVSQDNRCDLYMKEFSGEEYLLMSVGTSLKTIDEYVEKYSPDALLIETREGICNVDYILDNIEQSRYTLVYTCNASIKASFGINSEDDSYNTWRLYEINYAEEVET